MEHIQQTRHTKKNIVFIMADQLAACQLGCYGSGVNSTPVLNRLAAEGMRFERCYATSPICAPNRAVFLTGRSPCVNGIVLNNYALADDMPTYAHVLKAAGYRTGGFGKFHQTPMQFPEPKNLDFLGFDEGRITEDSKWPWYEWVKKEFPQHAEQALGKTWSIWPCYPPHPDLEKKKQMGDRKPEHKGETPWAPMYTSSMPPETHDTSYITNLGIDFMERHLDAHADSPFFCHISYVDPHDPFDPPEPYASMFDPSDMPDPLPAEWLDENIQTLADQQKYMGFDKHVLGKPDVIRKLRALYHGQLRYLDDQIARVISFVKERGLWENTIIVFTTDHGEMLADHGLMTKGYKHYDASIRCPLIVAGGGLPCGVNPGLVCTLDFYPSFCDWAGISEEDRPPLEGLSFADVSKQERWDAVSVAIGNMESVVTDDAWRLTRFVDENKGQMFDLSRDPGEQDNLYNDPAHLTKRLELFEKLVAVMNRGRRERHYRNLPVLDGRKLDIVADSVVGTRKLYTPTRSPALEPLGVI